MEHVEKIFVFALEHFPGKSPKNVRRKSLKKKVRLHLQMFFLEISSRNFKFHIQTPDSPGKHMIEERCRNLRYPAFHAGYKTTRGVTILICYAQ